VISYRVGLGNRPQSVTRVEDVQEAILDLAVDVFKHQSAITVKSGVMLDQSQAELWGLFLSTFGGDR